ncbi:hypothetical protein D917_03100, partial [Trichinella nativa]
GFLINQLIMEMDSVLLEMTRLIAGTVHACSNVNCNNRGTCEVKNFLPVCNCTDEMYEGAFCER